MCWTLGSQGRMRPLPALQDSQGRASWANSMTVKNSRFQVILGAQGGVGHIPAGVWRGDQGRLPGGGGARAELWLSQELREGVPGGKGAWGTSAGKPQMVWCSAGTYRRRQGQGHHEARFVLRVRGARVGIKRRRAGHSALWEVLWLWRGGWRGSGRGRRQWLIGSGGRGGGRWEGSAGGQRGLAVLESDLSPLFRARGRPFLVVSCQGWGLLAGPESAWKPLASMSRGCHNELPQTARLKATEVSSLTVL